MRDYSLTDRVITPHGAGEIVDIESHDSTFNTVKWDDEKAISWRYGIKHDRQPYRFNYPIMYYFTRELTKELL